jgi:hypothetical protein
MEARAEVKTFARLSITTRKLEEEIKKNWALVLVLVLGDVLSTVPAYFLSGFWSVAVTVLFISVFYGYWLLRRHACDHRHDGDPLARALLAGRTLERAS